MTHPDDSLFDDSGSLQDVSDDEPAGGAADDAADAADAGGEDPNVLENPSLGQVTAGSVLVREPTPTVGTGAVSGGAQ